MVDLLSPMVVLLVVLVVVLRRTSAGVAILALLAGVLIDQLLSPWLLSSIPKQNTVDKLYVAIAVHLILTFACMVVALSVVKATRQSLVVPILASLLLGFLVVYFGLKILEPIPLLTKQANNSGLITFLSPYQNVILAASSVLAVVAMVIDHKKISDKK